MKREKLRWRSIPTECLRSAVMERFFCTQRNKAQRSEIFKYSNREHNEINGTQQSVEMLTLCINVTRIITLMKY